MPISMLRNFFRLEAAAGIILFFAALLALGFENSQLEVFYDKFLNLDVVVKIGDFSIDKPLLLWINDGLMAIFFLLVGLESKIEFTEGQLSNRKQVILPAFAAFGGIALPALIYVFINRGNETNLQGWAIPAATDIAFALGIATLLGNRVHENLKITLMVIAIMDDIAAIIIIALFYTSNLSVYSLMFGLIAIVCLFTLNRAGVTKLGPYIIIGVLLWVCVIKSGVHATLAGIILAMFIPMRDKTGKKSPVETLEHALNPWVAYAILPIFAFANAGVSFHGLSLEILLHPITLGIALGLFFGKQIGVMLMTGLGLVLKLFNLPDGMSLREYYGMAVLTGVGFTMSLFIGTLAFQDYENQAAVRLGVIVGSLLSGIVGYFVLRVGQKRY